MNQDKQDRTRKHAGLAAVQPSGLGKDDLQLAAPTTYLRTLFAWYLKATFPVVSVLSENANNFVSHSGRHYLLTAAASCLAVDRAARRLFKDLTAARLRDPEAVSKVNKGEMVHVPGHLDPSANSHQLVHMILPPVGKAANSLVKARVSIEISCSSCSEQPKLSATVGPVTRLQHALHQNECGQSTRT